jgi:inosine-uridine nucleoside N-ribohydrolase
MVPRIRVISDNDYAGDPDGLFQLAHIVLSPSVDLRGVIGSHLRPGDVHDTSDQTATHARAQAQRVVELLGATATIVEGSNTALADARSPIRSAGAELIISEALRESALPLYVTLGGGLTELASAYLLEPRIADRLIAVWIGGPEHPGVAVPPPGDPEWAVSEYNTRIDIAAAQVVFDSSIPLWQVPRDLYRQAIMSRAELEARVRPIGGIGRHLMEALDHVIELNAAHGRDLGETYVLGDNPLVLLTALQTAFEPDPASSSYVTLPAPVVDDRGAYVARPDGRPIRVYTRIDTRLMFEDMLTKLGTATSRRAG